jgi:hypothetical protein
MHPPAVHAEVARLAEDGLRDAEIARELGLPRTTVRDIRVAALRPPTVRNGCPRCWKSARQMRFSAGEYAELLGYYLGDGHIVRVGRTQCLRISLDARHGQIVAEVCALLAKCFGENRVNIATRDGGATRVVYLYSSHLGCLFPQSGPGHKHERPIVLEDWQLALIDEAPFAFLRGLLHSDGCFFINRTAQYRYLSAVFTNHSDDIRALFCRACDRVGIEYRAGAKDVRIYRRASVERLALFVGAKW